jgi:hypothetical protein
MWLYLSVSSIINIYKIKTSSYNRLTYNCHYKHGLSKIYTPVLQKDNMSLDIRLLHLTFTLHSQFCVCVCVYEPMRTCIHTCNKAMETSGHKNTHTYIFLILTLERGEWASFIPQFLYSTEEHHTTHCMQSWVGPLAGLLAVEKSRMSAPFTSI